MQSIAGVPSPEEHSAVPVERAIFAMVVLQDHIS